MGETCPYDEETQHDEWFAWHYEHTPSHTCPHHGGSLPHPWWLLVYCAGCDPERPPSDDAA